MENRNQRIIDNDKVIFADEDDEVIFANELITLKHYTRPVYIKNIESDKQIALI